MRDRMVSNQVIRWLTEFCILSAALELDPAVLVSPDLSSLVFLLRWENVKMYGRVDVVEVSAGSDRQLFYLVSTDLMTGSGAILSLRNTCFKNLEDLT